MAASRHAAGFLCGGGSVPKPKQNRARKQAGGTCLQAVQGGGKTLPKPRDAGLAQPLKAGVMPARGQPGRPTAQQHTQYAIGPHASRDVKHPVLAACQNTMRLRNVKTEDLFPIASQVDWGVAELIHKQEAGWSYVRAGDQGAGLLMPFSPCRCSGFAPRAPSVLQIRGSASAGGRGGRGVYSAT